MKKKIRLKFMVDPLALQEVAYVKNPVKIQIVDTEAIFLTGILGESGRKLVEGGIGFYFEKVLADKLIKKGIAIRVKYPRRHYQSRKSRKVIQ